MTKLTIWGGAGEHGRSSYLLSGRRFRLLLDCGVKRGGAGEYPLIVPEQAQRLDAVLLSHAHEDHSVALPLLYAQGYSGEVWATRETRAQLDTYFRSWRSSVGREGHELPYTEDDEQAIRYRCLEEESGSLNWFEAISGVWMMWGRSGHLAGSVWFLIAAEGRSIFYSGDFTAESRLLQADSPAEALEAAGGGTHPQPGRALRLQGRPLDLAIVDAAYGMDQDTQGGKLKQLEQAIRRTAARGGKVLLPVPAGGRGQEMILWACECFADLPIVVEPKLVDGMRQLTASPFWLRDRDQQAARSALGSITRFLASGGWASPHSDTERERLLAGSGPSLWFVPDGMLQSALSRWYYARWAGHSTHSVLITGHVSAGTFGYRLLHEPGQHGVCEVLKLRYKVHQGRKDVQRMLQSLPVRHAVLVHAARPETDLLCEALIRDGGLHGCTLHSMAPGEELVLENRQELHLPGEG
ncbi:MBL fold metallo-hydrolase [Paenibacillus sp. S150]|uniref:MBL fold metallo-hydrolase n=1 Tax=Paenibacillus sp. S150 TaxID=2749826 RepID=UPI001C5712CB|nr:MBL fold metallo-hydrolase [Paenibacillus sp. S150]MBW4081205.1 MBL fold metallo-hydrolase [Paenibacillus sp. S150]